MDLVDVMMRGQAFFEVMVAYFRELSSANPTTAFLFLSTIVLLTFIFTLLYNMVVKSGFGRRAFTVMGFALMLTFALEFDNDVPRHVFFGLSIQFLGAFLVAFVLSDHLRLSNGVAFILTALLFIVPTGLFLLGVDVIFVRDLQLEFLGLLLAFFILFEEVAERHRKESNEKEKTQDYQIRYHQLVAEREKWGSMLTYMRKDTGENYRLAALELLRQRAVSEGHDKLENLYHEALELERKYIKEFHPDGERVMTGEDEAESVLPVPTQAVYMPHQPEPYTGELEVYDPHDFMGVDPERPQTGYAYEGDAQYVDIPPEVPETPPTQHTGDTEPSIWDTDDSADDVQADERLPLAPTQQEQPIPQSKTDTEPSVWDDVEQERDVSSDDDDDD